MLKLFHFPSVPLWARRIFRTLGSSSHPTRHCNEPSSLQSVAGWLALSICQSTASQLLPWVLGSQTQALTPAEEAPSLTNWSSEQPQTSWTATLPACERPLQGKAPTHKLDGLSSVCGTHTAERANSLKCTDLHTDAVGPFYTHIQMPKTFNFSKDKFLYKLKNLKTLSLCIFKCSQGIDNYPLRVWDCSLAVKQVFTICEVTRLIPTSI